MRASTAILGLACLLPAYSAYAEAPASGVTAPDGLDATVLARAQSAHACATARGDLSHATHPERLAIIDFSLPSTEARLWVLDLTDGHVLLHALVAHGQGTGALEAEAFSNAPGSHQSSVGVFRTAEVYQGQHGRSLRLDGLESGFNDLARERAIVVHGADYATADFAREHGRLGRSWGCPAVAPDVVDPLIDALAGGSLLVAHYPDPSWLSSSPYLSCDAP